MATPNSSPTPLCHSLEDIAKRKAELRQQMDSERQRIEKMWKELSTDSTLHTAALSSGNYAKPTMGQRIAAFIDYGMAFADAYMTVRKLFRRFRPKG